MDIDLIGLVIGVLSIPLSIAVSYYFYRKSIRKKSPTWAIRKTELISSATSSIPGLFVSYNGEEVANLSIVKIAFWNSGEATIDRADLDVDYAFRLGVSLDPDIKALSALVSSSNNPASNVVITRDEPSNRAVIDFEYLDKGDGMVIDLVLQGNPRDSISVDGSIKGAETIVQLQDWLPSFEWSVAMDFKRMGRRSLARRYEPRTIAWNIGHPLVLSIIGIGVAWENNWDPFIALGFVGGPLMLFAFALSTTIPLLKSRIPDDLDTFFDGI